MMGMKSATAPEKLKVAAATTKMLVGDRPAYPVNSPSYPPSPGMTLLQYYAGESLKSLNPEYLLAVKNDDTPAEYQTAVEWVACVAFDLGEAMVREAERRGR